MAESVAISNVSKINSTVGGSGILGQIVIALVFVVIAVVVYAYPFADQKEDRSVSDSVESSAIHSTSSRVPDQVQDTQPAPAENSEHSHKLIVSPASSYYRPEPTFATKLTNALDIEAFLRKLREEGISVMRLKNKKLSPKLLRLNDKGELYWAKSWFPKHVPLSKLINVIEPLEASGGFVLEFSGAFKVLNLRIPEHEFPFDTPSVMNYFKAIHKITNRNPDYLRKFLANESVERPYIEDDMGDAKSEVSELTTITTNTSPRGATHSGNFNGNTIRTPVSTNSPGNQAAAQSALEQGNDA
jgi:hypothetical protein